MTDERVEEIIEDMTKHEGYRYFISPEAGKELLDAGIVLEFGDKGIRWTRTH